MKQIEQKPNLLILSINFSGFIFYPFFFFFVVGCFHYAIYMNNTYIQGRRKKRRRKMGWGWGEKKKEKKASK